jgi:hypothetical protein
MTIGTKEDNDKVIINISVDTKKLSQGIIKGIRKMAKSTINSHHKPTQLDVSSLS